MMQKKQTDYIIEEKLDSGLTKHYEGVFAQGSGYLQIRGTFEEGISGVRQDEEYMRLPANVTLETPRHARSKCGTYIPGITGNHPLLKEEIVNLPNPLAFTVEADGTFLDMDQCRIRQYVRRLNLKNGILERKFVWDIPHGKSLKCCYRRYVSRTEDHLIVQKISYTAERGDITLSMVNDIDENVRTNGYQHFTSIKKQAVNGGCFVETMTDNKDCIRMLSKAAIQGSLFDKEENRAVKTLVLPEGESLEIQKMTVVSTSRDPEGLRTSEELGEMAEEYLKAEPKLFNEHTREWERLWAKSGVEITGDEPVQRAVNFSIYHLLRCESGKDSRAAICAKGFAGEAYFGHFFWDTEIYMLPFFLYTQPELAKKLEEFRVRTLRGAMTNASEYGYPGARYPWESGVTGLEQCPNWQYADHEVHVTADVTFGLWHYYENTGDIRFLKAAAPVFTETARYWMKRMYRDRDGGVHINGVMGPDEYVCICDDNAYTNYMVALSLKNTGRILEILEQVYPEIGMELNVDSSFIREVKETAEKIIICRNKEGIILQCRHFEELEEPDFASVWKDPGKPFGRFISQERNYRTKALKQADVLMLFYLFEKGLQGDSLKKNYEYYLPYTTHDSSLSSIIHAILCCKTKDLDEAYRFFGSAVRIDTDEELKGAAEGIHIANCGGIWQAVIFGFAGLRWAYECDGPRFSPALPKHWEKISFPLFFRGKEYFVKVTKEGVWVNDERYE